jgi:hypothetical protein
MQGNFMVQFDTTFKVMFKVNLEDDPIEVFNGDLNKYNLNNVSSISYNHFDHTIAITTKKENGYLVEVYNTEWKQFYPETVETKYNFCQIGSTIASAGLSFRNVPQIVSCNSLDANKKIVYLVYCVFVFILFFLERRNQIKSNKIKSKEDQIGTSIS